MKNIKLFLCWFTYVRHLFSQHMPYVCFSYINYSAIVLFIFLVSMCFMFVLHTSTNPRSLYFLSTKFWQLYQSAGSPSSLRAANSHDLPPKLLNCHTCPHPMHAQVHWHSRATHGHSRSIKSLHTPFLLGGILLQFTDCLWNEGECCK